MRIGIVLCAINDSVAVRSGCGQMEALFMLAACVGLLGEEGVWRGRGRGSQIVYSKKTQNRKEEDTAPERGIVALLHLEHATLPSQIPFAHKQNQPQHYHLNVLLLCDPR